MADKSKYLDSNGLLYFWSKIKSALSGKVDTTTFNTALSNTDTKLSNINTKIGELETSISGITGFEYQIVTALPTTGAKGIIYLVAHDHGTSDGYDEYIWLTTSNKFEKIGNTDITIETIKNAEIDTIVAS